MQDVDGDPAGLPFGEGLPQCLEGATVMVVHDLVVAPVPAGPAEQHGVAVASDGAGDLLEVQPHGVGVGEGQRQGGVGAAVRADDAEQVGAFEALGGGLAGPCSPLRPLAHEDVPVADAGLVLKPDPIGFCRGRWATCALRISGQFLNASIARTS